MSTGNGAGPIIGGGQTRAGGQVGRALGTGVVVGKDESSENLKEKSEGAMGERDHGNWEDLCGWC